MDSRSRIRSVSRALAYMQSFGVARGLDLFLKTLSGPRIVSLRLPGYPAPVLLRTRTSDIQTFGQVFVSEEYDFPLPDPEPRLIIDGGAYVGYTTLYFANRFPEARVLAIEPAEENFLILGKNTAACPNVRLVRGGLWNRKCLLKLGNPDGLHWSFQVDEAAAGEGADPRGDDAIEAFTIPELIRMAGGGRIDILKLDIEGAEKVLFGPGCEDWLDSVRVIMIEMHDRFEPGCSSAFYRAIAGRDFNQLIKGENVAVFLDMGRGVV